MKRKPLIIAFVVCVVVSVLTVYRWRTTSDVGGLQSFSTFLTPSKPASHSATFAVTDKVAVIVEDRPITTLIPLILHFASVLGPGWPIHFFTRATTLHVLRAFTGGSQPFQRMINSGQIKITELPSGPYIGNYTGVSDFLASEWFWMQMEPAKRMLLFQTDSIICANSHRPIEEFLEYDFIGAAHPYLDYAFNGGLSIRNVPLSLEIVRAHPIQDDMTGGTFLGPFEDAWFCQRMVAMGAHMPSRDTASEFVVDFGWAERPLGYHGVNRGLHEDRLDEIYAWCPEAMLAANQIIANLTEEEQAKNSTDYPDDSKAVGGRILSFG